MSVILQSANLGPPPWPCVDPFLFCVHHDDAYPPGNGAFGPAASLSGRNLGQDFAGKDGWRMYHGESIPGFPPHPHRGFETVTVVRKGWIDHSDSLGAAARFGAGDVQWMTAGRGIVHSEMFPMLETNAPNPLELFQIWINLPSADKMVEPYFSMFWNTDIPRIRAEGPAGRFTDVVISAGAMGVHRPPKPPPHSWASRPDTDVAIWTIRLDSGASWTLPAAQRGDVVRAAYFFRGKTLDVAGQKVNSPRVMILRPDVPVLLENGESESEILILQGRPIQEPVASHGPFVMNTTAEIQQAFDDYRRTRFGGWPWPSQEPVHPADSGRFAKRPDGSVERSS